MASDSEEAPFARAVLITLAVLALYVLSIGPVWRYTVFGNGPSWLWILYDPIVWTADHCAPIDKALHWYLALWEPPLPPSFFKPPSAP